MSHEGRWRRMQVRWLRCVIAAGFVVVTLPVSFLAAAPQAGSSIVLWRSLAGGSGQPYELDVPPPPAVRHAGGRELREFKQGRAVAASVGCEACHRIGDQGNAGPGVALTHIGSKLTKREIRRALLDPRPPMPSFKGLPRHKLLPA